MRLRSLSVSLLTAAVLLPLAALPAEASGTATSPLSGSIFKNSATKRMGTVAPTSTSTAPVVDTRATTISAYSAAAIYQNEVLVRTNAERTKRGLRPVAKHLCPDGYADRWAVKLASLGKLAHQPLSPILTACRARRVGENVAYGNVSAAQLVSMWMNSAGHRANILNPAYTHIGVGSHKTATGRVYGVQVFVTL